MDAAVQPFQLERIGTAWRARFQAMASPCELLVEGISPAQAHTLAALAQHEALRIEHKFSRYREGSIVAAIHAACGRRFKLDAESADLVDYAAACHALSGGLFDITSGVLRQAWRFDGSDRLPAPEQVAALLAHVGWSKVEWQRPFLRLPEGMEIDFGGVGKEYAVDRVLAQLQSQAAVPMLVNFGGDLAVSGARADGSAWQVGLERPGSAEAALMLDLRAGALATSGDARRFLLKDRVRYGHILDPRDGWPVRRAPRSVTVAAGRCTEAGSLATLAMLQGARAESWLAAQGVPHWILR